MEKGSGRRVNSSKEHRHWNVERVCERISGSDRCGRTSLEDQSTDPAAKYQEHQLGDTRKTLSGARTPGYLQRNKADAGCGRRGSQVLRDPGHLRGIFGKVDPSTVAFLSSFRREGSRCRKMAEDTLLPKDRHSARSGEQSENQKHHECALLACNSFGSGRTAIRSRAFARVQSDRKHQTSWFRKRSLQF